MAQKNNNKLSPAKVFNKANTQNIETQIGTQTITNYITDSNVSVSNNPTLQNQIKSQSQLVQQFESTFFSLLDLYKEIMNSFSNKVSGKKFFAKIKRELQSTYKFQFYLEERLKIPSGYEYYEEFYNRNKDNLAHYFRMLYRIFTFIDQTPSLNMEQKWFYAKIVRSQLCEGELFILFYNSFSQYGKNFKPLNIKYNLLKHLPIIDKLEISRFYRKEFRYEITLNNVFLQYDINSSPAIELIKELFRNLEEIIRTVILTKNEIRKSILYDRFLFYDLKGSYQENVLKIELIIDVEGSNTPGNFYSKFGLNPNSDQLLIEMLKEFLYIKIVQESFYNYQNIDNIEIERGWKFDKARKSDSFCGENLVWASIKRNDNKEIQILTDTF